MRNQLKGIRLRENKVENLFIKMYVAVVAFQKKEA